MEILKLCLCYQVNKQDTQDILVFHVDGIVEYDNYNMWKNTVPLGINLNLCSCLKIYIFQVITDFI